MPSRVPRNSRSAATKICVCLPMTSGCPIPHRKFRPLLTSILPRRPLSVLHCRRRNSQLVLSVMFFFLHVSRLLSRVPCHCCHSRVSLSCRCHSRSHPLLTLPSLVLLEPIYPRISHQSGRKHEFSFRLQVAQLSRAVMVAIASRTVSATRRTVSRNRQETQTVASSRVDYHSRNRLEICGMS